MNIDAILRQCRLTVCEAYVSGGHDAALAALASASIRLFRHVINSSLIGEVAYDQLRELADNLTLTRVLGDEAVELAIGAGPSLYRALNGALPVEVAA